jgi:hypothetical protein
VEADGRTDLAWTCYVQFCVLIMDY